VWIKTSLPVSYPVQLAISISPRLFPRAVDRNNIKRQIREIYRLNKSLLYDFCKEKNMQYALMIIYTSKNKYPYPELKEKIILSLERFKIAVS